jgi:hypothetical protein
MPAARRDDYEAHLFTCAPCYARYRATVEVRRGLGELGAEAPPEYLHERVTAAVEAAGREKAARRAWRPAPAWWPLASAAVFVAAVLVGLFVFSRLGVAPTVPAVERPVVAVHVAPAPTPGTKAQPPVVAAQPEAAPERPSVFRRAAEAILARATGEKPKPSGTPLLGGGSAAPAPTYEGAPKPAPVTPGPAEGGGPALATLPTPTQPLIGAVARALPSVPHLPVAAPALREGPSAARVAAPAATPSTPARRPEVIARTPAPVAPAPAARQPQPSTPEPVRIADASDSHPRWLPVHEAETGRLVASPPATHLLQDTARRVNTELAQDERRSNEGWVVIH